MRCKFPYLQHCLQLANPPAQDMVASSTKLLRRCTLLVDLCVFCGM